MDLFYIKGYLSDTSAVQNFDNLTKKTCKKGLDIRVPLLLLLQKTTATSATSVVATATTASMGSKRGHYGSKISCIVSYV